MRSVRIFDILIYVAIAMFVLSVVLAVVEKYVASLIALFSGITILSFLSRSCRGLEG